MILSISFTGSKFNGNLKNDYTFDKNLLIILKTYVYHVHHRFIN